MQAPLGGHIFPHYFKHLALKFRVSSYRKEGMTKEYPLEKMDLALFETEQTNEFSQLKDFLSFLKLYGYPRPYKFSHVESSGPLIENLSLDENLLLHASTNDVEDEKESIRKMLEQSGNPHLVRLYNAISLKQNLPAQVDDETRKAMALVKALVQDVEFLFLENPEKYLGKAMLSLFVQALVYKSATTGLIVVINTKFKNIWTQHLTKRIFRDEKNFFQVDHYNTGLSNTLLQMQNLEDAQSEGVLKIVNTNAEELEEDSKKSA